jgi:hypothetical protein
MPCRPIQFRKIPLQKSCIWKPLAYLCIWIGILYEPASWIRINIYICCVCVCVCGYQDFCAFVRALVSNAIAKHIWIWTQKEKERYERSGPRNTRAPFAYVQMLLSFFPFVLFFSFFLRLFSLFFLSRSLKVVWFVHGYRTEILFSVVCI